MAFPGEAATAGSRVRRDPLGSGFWVGVLVLILISTGTAAVVECFALQSHLRTIRQLQAQSAQLQTDLQGLKAKGTESDAQASAASSTATLGTVAGLAGRVSKLETAVSQVQGSAPSQFSQNTLIAQLRQLQADVERLKFEVGTPQVGVYSPDDLSSQVARLHASLQQMCNDIERYSSQPVLLCSSY